MTDLAEQGQALAAGTPLAERMRPQTLQEVMGQRHLVAEGKLLAIAIAADAQPSMVLWGPPGSGKTTLAHVIANETRARFVTLNAVMSGVAELRKTIAEAAALRAAGDTRTILFIDEIHRFNKAQQDALLPHVEKGTVTLIGATTENPSFALNAALLSRARVCRLEPLDSGPLRQLLCRALADTDRGLGRHGLRASREVLAAIAERADGDARRALDALETAARHALACRREVLELADAKEALAAQTLLYDKSGEQHYNVISAFIKAMRGSDPDAAVYWMMRMLEAGEDPLFILRRMLIFASEDVGNADPRALSLAVAADQAFQRLGLPEGIYPMAQCCLYLASVPKSNATTRAWTAAQKDVRKHGALAVPLHLRNAPTKLMRESGYGQGYRYPHDEPDGFARGVEYLPRELRDRSYYEPSERGLEAQIRKRLESLRKR